MANFKCGLHNFSTDDPKEWDKHCEKNKHEYDLHIICAGGCGTQLHIKPNQKLTKAAKRVPRGYMCDDCKKLIQNTPTIKEAGES